MIEGCRNVCRGNVGGDVAGVLATAHINDGRTSHGVENMYQFGVFIHCVANDVGQI